MVSRVALVGFVVVLSPFACGRDREAPTLARTERAVAGGDHCRGTNQFSTTPSPLGPISDVQGSNVRPANTFSIVARDPVTGDLGVAVQSHWFSVGSVVTWAEPGVGAIATQSFVEPAYGPRGLALLREGTPPVQAIAQLVASDPSQAMRQLGFVDAQGRVAAHTGEKCIGKASHHIGVGYSVQANLMANDDVVPAIARAFESAHGDLAERMLVAMEAGQAAGGDLRGCQSAAIVVVSGSRATDPWVKKLDLRVEDHAAPLGELRRLVTLARAYDHMNQGDVAVEKQDIAKALEHYTAASKLSSDNPEMIYWQAVALAGAGQVERATPLFQQAFRVDAAWRELTRRLPASGLLAPGVAEVVTSGK